MDPVEERLADLERQNRRMKALLVAMGLLAGSAAFLAASPADRDVQVRSLKAQRIDLVDAEGKDVGFLGLSEEGSPSLVLRQGRTTASLLASEDTAQVEVSGGPKRWASMEAGTQTLASLASGDGRVTIDVTDLDPSIAMVDGTGKPRVVLHGRNQDPCLMFVDGDFGKVRAYIGSPPAGGRVQLISERGQKTVYPR
ncbi:MAG TPA: hypothetical protein VMY37_28135 [Thermoguttaceae bacterium]|nr:hypothetical protein [Thermoguttaceae bacterium]